MLLSKPVPLQFGGKGLDDFRPRAAAAPADSVSACATMRVMVQHLGLANCGRDVAAGHGLLRSPGARTRADISRALPSRGVGRHENQGCALLLFWSARKSMFYVDFRLGSGCGKPRACALEHAQARTVTDAAVGDDLEGHARASGY